MPGNKVSLPSEHIAQNLDKTCQRPSSLRTLTGAQQLRVDGQQRGSKQTYNYAMTVARADQDPQL